MNQPVLNHVATSIKALNIETIVNIALCILSFILALISVITVVITIRQNNKMIKSNTRAYVVASLKIVTIRKQRSYIVIKNYGNSGATIDNLSFDIDLDKYSFNQKLHPFSHTKGVFIAPNQKYMSVINGAQLTADGIQQFNVTIEYHDSFDHYKETYSMNYKGYIENIVEREQIEGNELQNILNALENLIEDSF